MHLSKVIHGARRARALSTALAVAPSVGVSAVIFPVFPSGLVDLSRVLLIERATAPAAGQWCFPGGRLELGETMPEAAAREVLEEASLRVLVPARPLAALAAHDVLVRGLDGSLRFHYAVVHVLGFALSSALPIAADDAAQAAWVTIDDGLHANSTTPPIELPPSLVAALIAASGQEPARQSSKLESPSLPLPELSLRSLLCTGVAIPEVLDVLDVALLWLRSGFALASTPSKARYA